jgi:hypothetical protein
MNNTQKILIAIGVGVGVAYVYKKFKPSKPTTGTGATGKSKSVDGTFVLPEDSAVSDMSREEKEEFILENASTTPQEIASGFEGVRFVWNPLIGKMYPVGTIVEGEEPTFGEIFNSAEGDVVTDIEGSVENAEMSLKDLNDQELELLFRIVKKIKENPSIMSEEEAVTQMGVTNPNIIKVVNQKLRKILNDIKIMKKDASWTAKWEARKVTRRNRRKEFKEKMGFGKDSFDRVVAKKCGRKPRLGQKAQYKKCVEMVADTMRSQIKNDVQSQLSSAPVSVKDDVSRGRQESFAKQMTNRSSGGIYGGKRWDGKSNKRIESMVDAGLI